MTQRHLTFFWYDRMLVGALALGSIVSVAAIEWTPHDRLANVAVVFPPWVRSADASRRVASAGASLLRDGRFPFIMIVHPQTDDFYVAVRREGALLILDASALGGCLVAAHTS